MSLEGYAGACLPHVFLPAGPCTRHALNRQREGMQEHEDFARCLSHVTLSQLGLRGYYYEGCMQSVSSIPIASFITRPPLVNALQWRFH